MKTPRRIVTVALSLAVAACALVLTLRSFAQSGPYDISLPSDYQKLKPPYDGDDGTRWENAILKKHAKKYCITYRKKNGDQSKHCPKSVDASKALPVPVANESSAMPVSDKPMGSNVTQSISCGTADDKAAIEATFDMSATSQ